MRARLYCPVGDCQLDHTFDAEATLGRGPDNSVVLGQELLSSHHLRIAWSPEAGSYLLEDLQSSNGTRLDGARVREAQRLGHLHVITLAERFPLVFQDLEACAARHGKDVAPGSRPLPADKTLAEPLPLPLPAILSRAGAGTGEDSGEIAAADKTLFERLPLPMPAFLRPKASDDSGVPSTAIHPSAPPAPQKPLRQESRQQDTRRSPALGPTLPPETPLNAFNLPTEDSPAAANLPAGTLVLEVAEEKGVKRYRLSPGPQTLGRGMEASIRILSPQVSRCHATLTVSSGRVSLRDEGSSNHTFVDGRQIEQEVEVRPGQRIAFGVLEARLIAAETASGEDAEGAETP